MYKSLKEQLEEIKDFVENECLGIGDYDHFVPAIERAIEDLIEYEKWWNEDLADRWAKVYTGIISSYPGADAAVLADQFTEHYKERFTPKPLKDETGASDENND